MNVLSRSATPEELTAAAEIILSQAELDRMFAEAQAVRSREARRQQRARWGRISLLVALSGVCIAQGAALAALVPLVRVEPVFVYLRDDGTSISSRSWADLPADAREANLANVLALYVRLREGWSSGDAAYAWDTVSALSSKVVREQFQTWFRKESPESPQRIYGEKSSLSIVVTDVQKDPTVEGAYRVYFTRTQRAADTVGRPVPMVANLRIRSVANPKSLPWWQRVSFNGPAIQVWEYPGAVPAGPGGASK
jgi:type IV secretion system protein VirB8